MTILRLCTFNVQNLNAVGVSFFGRFEDRDKPYDTGELDDKTGFISAVLREGKPDVVGFQEVFHIDALQAALAKTGVSYKVYCPDCEGGQNVVDERFGDGSQTRRSAKGPFVALVTKLDILEQERISDFPPGLDLRIDGPTRQHPDTPTVSLAMKTFERPVLRVKVKLPTGSPCWVFVAHLKSKLPFYFDTDDQKDPVTQATATIRSLIRRGAEAMALRALMIEKLRGTKDPVVLLGDLNDDLPAVTTQALTGTNPAFVKKEDRPAVADLFLHSVHDIQDRQSFRDVSYSHIFEGRYELLDHVFVSEELVRWDDGLGRVLGTRIFNDHIFDRQAAAFDSGPKGRVRSDHGVPVTEILLKDP